MERFKTVTTIFQMEYSCNVCNGSRISYWSDGVDGYCLECCCINCGKTSCDCNEEDQEEDEEEEDKTLCPKCLFSYCICYQIIDENNLVNGGNTIMVDDILLFEKSDVNPNCLQTFLMEKMQEIIRSMWEELGPSYSTFVYHAAFEIELRELKLSYKIDDGVPIMYKDSIINNFPDFVIEGLLRVQMTFVNRSDPTLLVRFSKI